MEFEWEDLGSLRPPTEWTALYDPSTERPRTKKTRSKTPRKSKRNSKVCQDSNSFGNAHSDMAAMGASPIGSSLLPTCGDGDLPPHLLNFGRQWRQQREFSGPSLLVAESEEGFVEYKLRLSANSSARFNQLVTQLKFRLCEGDGQCFYFLGVEDNGHPRGLEPEELSASIETLERMAAEVSAFVTVTRTPPGTEGRRCAVLSIHRSRPAPKSGTEVRVAVSGSADCGKSTLVAVLTRGADGVPTLDNGRGAARMSVLRHKHEIESGRTSCVSHQLLGYDSRGNALNYTRVAAFDPGEFAHTAARTVRLCDLGGHERFSKTSLHGITSTVPDCVMVCVSASTGVTWVTLDHLAVALALGVPPVVAVTKIDAATPGQLERLKKEMTSLMKAARRSARGDNCWFEDTMNVNADVFCKEGEEDIVAPIVLSTEHALSLATRIKLGVSKPEDLVVPIFYTSSTTGAGIDVLHAFLNALATQRVTQSTSTLPKDGSLDQLLPLETPAPPAHFQIDHVFEITEVGTVLSGVLIRGNLRVGDVMLLGPEGESGQFHQVQVQSIHRSQVEVDRVTAGHHATLAIGAVDVPGRDLEGVRGLLQEWVISAVEDDRDAPTTTRPGSREPLLGSSSSASSLANFAFYCEDDSDPWNSNLAARTISVVSSSSQEDPEEVTNEQLPHHSDDGAAKCSRNVGARELGMNEPPILFVAAGTCGSDSDCIDSCKSGRATPTTTSVEDCRPVVPSRPLHVRTALTSVDTHPPTKCKSRASLEELTVLSRSWQFANELRVGQPPSSMYSTTTLGSRPHQWKIAAASPRARKGAVLVDPSIEPRASVDFEAYIVVLGGHWPTGINRNGFLQRQTSSLSAGAADLVSASGSDTCASDSGSPLPRMLCNRRRTWYTPVVHCGGVRQAAAIVESRELESLEHSVSPYWTPEIEKSCMAAVGALSPNGQHVSSSPHTGPGASKCIKTIRVGSPRVDASCDKASSRAEFSSVSRGSVARVAFRFCHRPEWIFPGARLVLRDMQVSGRVVGAGVVVATGGNGMVAADDDC